MQPLDTHTHELENGYSLRISISQDEDHAAPWKECDGHGPVSDWENRDKAPGEWILASDRSSKRFYDAAEAIRIAKRDGWGLGPDAIKALVLKLKKADSSELTRGEIVTEAVRRDFEFLRAWCNDEWHHIGYTAHLMHEGEDGDTSGVKELDAACWGFESTTEGRAYMLETAIEEATAEASKFLQSIADIEAAMSAE